MLRFLSSVRIARKSASPSGIDTVPMSPLGRENQALGLVFVDREAVDCRIGDALVPHVDAALGEAEAAARRAARAREHDREPADHGDQRKKIIAADSARDGNARRDDADRPVPARRLFGDVGLARLPPYDMILHRSIVYCRTVATLDVIVDLQYGDSGKGKVAHHLVRTKKYTHVLRYNGGCNAGHTIFHKGKKFVTHHIPAGVFFGITSVIGSGCVVDPVQFFKEIQMLEAGGIKTKGKIFIARNAHVITDAHKAEDKKKGGAIGTTGRGNGPAYRDKYGRTGVRAESVPALKPYLMDLYEEFDKHGDKAVVLGEGAQGFGPRYRLGRLSVRHLVTLHGRGRLVERISSLSRARRLGRRQDL